MKSASFPRLCVKLAKVMDYRNTQSPKGFGFYLPSVSEHLCLQPFLLILLFHHYVSYRTDEK